MGPTISTNRVIVVREYTKREKCDFIGPQLGCFLLHIIAQRLNYQAISMGTPTTNTEGLLQFNSYTS